MSLDIYPGDFLTLSTDGANITWTTSGGFNGEPFRKAVIGELPIENAIQDNLAEIWLSFLETVNGIDDDASLIIARMTENDIDTHVDNRNN